MWKYWYAIPFIFVRLLATFFSQIPDCDEVFNYWEPLHFLLYGSGLQTWEYAPKFALRTYAYPLLHAVPIVLSEFLFNLSSKISLFYAVRTVLALSCCVTEVYFVGAVRRKYGTRVAWMTGIFLLCSPGMFLSSPTFLPSTFTMLALTVSMSAWMDKAYGIALSAATIGTFLSCWPYVAVSFVPIGLDALARRNVFAVIGWCVIMILVVNIPMMALDAHYYGFVVYAPWNIVRYNVVEAKAHLYGLESWSYYPMNLILNFNICFPLSVTSMIIPVWKLFYGKRTHAIDMLLHLAPLYIWALVMQTRPHKEERFIYFVYQSICFSAALSLDGLCQSITYMICSTSASTNTSTSTSVELKKKKDDAIGTNVVNDSPANAGSSTSSSSTNKCYWFLSTLSLFIFFLLSSSRVINIIKNFRAPMEIYQWLYDVELPRQYGELSKFHHQQGAHDADHHDLPKLKYTKDYYNSDLDKGDHVAVCVGKEWYRYPSSFYMRPWSRLYFIKSSFTGQLPQHYVEHEHGTRLNQPYFNDNNEEEITRYIDMTECHYIIDLDLGPGSESTSDPRYTSIKHSSEWEILHNVPFLNSHQSPRLTRAFYIPEVITNFIGKSLSMFKKKNTYSSYVLLRNRNPPFPHLSPSRYKRWEEFELKDKYVRKRRTNRLKEERQKQLYEENKDLHVPTLWPDIVYLVDGEEQDEGHRHHHHQKDGIVTTLAGKDGWWNREIIQKYRHLLFVYGENHRDYTEMDASLHPTNGKLIHTGKVHQQSTTQANIRGEFNAFPIRTVWYTQLPASDT